jgi:hypothetical protein
MRSSSRPRPPVRLRRRLPKPESPARARIAGVVPAGGLHLGGAAGARLHDAQLVDLVRSGLATATALLHITEAGRRVLAAR